MAHWHINVGEHSQKIVEPVQDCVNLSYDFWMHSILYTFENWFNFVELEDQQHKNL